MIELNATGLFENRGFSRVNLSAIVTVIPSQPLSPDGNAEKKSIQGKTVDITGNGLLARFYDKPPKGQDQVRLHVFLPTEPPEEITLMAHQVRAVMGDDNVWNVAYHFDNIPEEDRDKIVGCCLVRQRSLLRVNAQINDLYST